MRLLPKIVLSVLLPVMAGAGAVLYVVAGNWQRTLEAELIESSRRELVARVETVPAGLRAARETLRLLARSPVLAAGALPDIRRSLGQWDALTTHFEMFSFVDRAGLAYQASGDPLSIADRDYFPSIERGEEILGQPVISRFSGQPVLVLAVPVHGRDGRLVGTLGGTIVLDRFFERVIADARLRQGRFLLTDGTGIFLAGPLDGNEVSLRAPDPRQAPATAAVVEAIAGAVRSGGVSTELRVPVGEDVLRVLHAPVPMLSWRLAYVVPESQLFAPIMLARRIAWSVIVAATLAALAIGFLLHRLILRPLGGLRQAHARLQRGERGARAQASGSDEFSDLAASFNAMAESVERSESVFRAVFEAAPYAVTLNRMADGTYLDVNPAFETRSGLARAEVVGKTSVELGVAVDAGEAKARAEELLAAGRLDDIEARGIDKNGNDVWTLYSARLIELAGEPVALSMTVDITALKRTEQALRDSEAGFMALFDLAPIPLAYTLETDNYSQTRWNDAWYKGFGYSREEAHMRNGTDIGLWVDPVDRAAYLGAALADGTVSGREVLLRRKDGGIRQVELFGRFIRAGGKRLLMTAYLDVTDARRAETALREREMWLRSLFEVSPVAVLVVDLQGVVRECNQRFGEMLGYGQGEVLGHSYFDFVHPTEQEQARHGVGRMLVDPGLSVFSTERTYLRRDGSPLFGLLSARRLPASGGGDDVLLVIINDLSDLRKAKAQHLESETKLQAVFNETPTAMIVSDARRNYIVVAANDAWERQFLRRREEVMGMTGAEMGLWASTPDRDRVLAAIESEGRVDGFETPLVRGDGVELLCRVSARKVAVGDTELLVVVQEDVTELRRAEKTLHSVNRELARQLALSDAVARAQSGFIADALSAGAFESLLADLLRLSESEYGFIGEVLENASGQPYLKTHAITNIAWSDETRAFYEAHAAQGLEFRNMNTLFGAAIVGGEPVIANDPANDPRRGGLPSGHPRMDAFLGMPIRIGERVVALAGIANRPGGYDQALVSWLQPLLLTIGQMVEARRATLARLAAESALRELNEMLDSRVRERTEELARANDGLSEALDTLRRAQGDLVRSEKLAALGSLVAGVAHELNTPIGNSVTVASTLAEQSETFAAEMGGAIKRSALVSYVDGSRRAAELLLSNLQRAANLVSSFKQVAVDQTSEQRRRFEVGEVVDEILAMLHPQLKKHPLDIRREIPGGLALDSYPGPFGQVVANLVNNAAIHAFDDGRARGVIRLEAHAEPGGVRFIVSDDGIGIDPDHLDRIFDPFFTTRLGQGGSGLGLNIVYNIVTGVLGGAIRVESRPGEGCAFIVFLPAAAPYPVAG